jgi:hypothetical protein
MNAHKKLIEPKVAQAELVHALGIQNLPDDEQQEIVTGFLDGCMQQATALILSQLPEGSLEKVDALLDAGELEAVQALIAKHVPNAAQIMDEAVKIGIEEFKELVKEQKK